MNFAPLAHGRDNNMQLLRILAAAAVIVSHSFPITGRPIEPGAYGVTLGTLAVWVFFALSGFLIYKSFERQPLWAFIEARALRIYPALIVVTLLTVVVLGPAMTTLPLATYFTDRATIQYIPRALSLKFVSFSLPGVFGGYGVNGPTWTLWYEVVCYAGLALGLGMLRSFRLFLVCFAVLLLFARDTTYAELMLAFVTGMAAYRYRDRLPASAWVAVGLLIASALFHALAPIAVGYAALCLAQVKGPWLAYNRLGDYSYGLYIYGWPVQMLVMAFLPSLSPLVLAATALPLALGLAYLSWTIVERPALNQKGRLVAVRQRVCEFARLEQKNCQICGKTGRIGALGHEECYDLWAVR